MWSNTEIGELSAIHIRVCNYVPKLCCLQTSFWFAGLRARADEKNPSRQSSGAYIHFDLVWMSRSAENSVHNAFARSRVFLKTTWSCLIPMRTYDLIGTEFTIFGSHEIFDYDPLCWKLTALGVSGMCKHITRSKDCHACGLCGNYTRGSIDNSILQVLLIAIIHQVHHLFTSTCI